MEYLIVRDRQQVLLGPMNWRPRFISREFQEEEINCEIPYSDPEGYLDLLDSNNNQRIEIFPVVINIPSAYDSRLHALVGPYYTYENNMAYGEYQLQEKPVAEIKEKLKELVATIRYEREIAGISVDIQNNLVLLDTSRENRGRYTELLSSIGDKTIDFKIPGGFVTVDAAILKLMTDAVFLHVQNQFTWELGLCAEIENAASFDDLKTILDTKLKFIPTAVL